MSIEPSSHFEDRRRTLECTDQEGHVAIEGQLYPGTTSRSFLLLPYGRLAGSRWAIYLCTASDLREGRHVMT